MTPSQRFLLGPLISFLTVVSLAVVDRYWFSVRFPVATGFLPIVFAAFISGLPSALVSAIIALGNTLMFFPDAGRIVELRPDSLSRAGLLLLISAAVGVVLRRETRAAQRMRRTRDEVAAANGKLLTLSAALNQVSHGVVLLDSDLRAQFINTGYRKLWRLPAEIAEGNPSLAELMQYSRDIGMYTVASDQLDEYIRGRLEMVRLGDAEPLDLSLSGGEVVRFQCAVLPEGGRMLSYINVTDLYRHSTELEQQARTDSLTGLLNRRGFFEASEVEWRKSNPDTRPVCMLMIDIDWFKSINDRFGHDVGDQVIVAVANVFRDVMRSTDVTARIGGEEFAVLLPESDAVGACEAAERFRNEVAKLQRSPDGHIIATTVSIGVAVATADMHSLAALFKAADTALYQAKLRGRDRVVLASRDLSLTMPALAANAVSSTDIITDTIRSAAC